jgi:CDP-diacylglycerol--glycerol-3-phosphate 3-phosphatidyltransferase
LFDGRFRTGVDRVTGPIGNALVRTGLAPDHLTAFGLVLSVPTALAIATGHLGLGLALLIFSAVPDLLDGALAKASGRATVRGAFFDSVCDRVTDTFVLGGFAWYLQDRHGGHAAMLPFAILGASLLVSYLRAKAESLGFDAKVGLMERAERIVVLCAGLAFSFLLVPLLWVMLALTIVTALQRFVKVWRQATISAARPRTGCDTDDRVPPTFGHALSPETPDTVAASVDPMLLTERWRAWRESTGWVPRAERAGAGTRRGEAGQRRPRRLPPDQAAEAPHVRRRRSTRRP